MPVIDRSWHLPEDLPPDNRQVVAELKPKDKRHKKQVFSVVRYFRANSEGHDGDAAWWDPARDDDVEIVRWQYIWPHPL
jgi:hypothetical protein